MRALDLCAPDLRVVACPLSELYGDGGFPCSIAQIVGPRVRERQKSNTWTETSASCGPARSSVVRSPARSFRLRSCDIGALTSRRPTLRRKSFCSATRRDRSPETSGWRDAPRRVARVRSGSSRWNAPASVTASRTGKRICARGKRRQTPVAVEPNRVFLRGEQHHILGVGALEQRARIACRVAVVVGEARGARRSRCRLRAMLRKICRDCRCPQRPEPGACRRLRSWRDPARDAAWKMATP